MIRKILANVLLVSLLFGYCTNLLPSYGILELAIYLRVPEYHDFDSLVQTVKDQEIFLNTKILTKVTKKKDLHMTLTYPLIPLDENVIGLFPRIQRSVNKLPFNKQAQAYRNKIPNALARWLSPRVKQWFISSQEWYSPISLPFLKLQKLGDFLTVEFSLDTQDKLLAIVEAIKNGLKDTFSSVRFAFDDMIPLLSLGKINSSFIMSDLMQPEFPVAPLLISKASSHEIVVSVRMQKN